MKQGFGLYEVTGRRAYRGHPTGTIFEARLDRLAEARAVARGDIRLLEHVKPALPEGHTLPEGWAEHRDRAAERRLAS